MDLSKAFKSCWEQTGIDGNVTRVHSRQAINYSNIFHTFPRMEGTREQGNLLNTRIFQIYKYIRIIYNCMNCIAINTKHKKDISKNRLCFCVTADAKKINLFSPL